MKQANVFAVVVALVPAGLGFAEPTTDRAVTAVGLRVSPVAATGRFVSVPASASGVDLTYSIDLESPRKHLYVSGFACGGVAAGDLDGDGLPDLVFAGTSGTNRLFVNRGGFRFEDRTVGSGVAGGGSWGSAVVMIDIDNDGDLDLYVANYDAPNRLFLNDGKARFTESAEAFGLDIAEASLAPAFCDYDLDGDLDLYLLANRFYSPRGFPDSEGDTMTPEQAKYFQAGKSASGKREWNVVPRPDRLLRNDGGRFTDVSRAAGITADPRHGLAATWWDFDKDLHPDLYVSNDYDDPDSLYHNNGDGTFTDVTAEVLPHTAWFSMGADSADINNDGWPDFLAADMSGTTHFKDKTTMGAMGSRLWVTLTDPRQYMRNALYLGSGTGRMMEAAYLAGVADSDWTWAVKFADFDGDGRDDLFLSNGMTRNFNNSDLPFAKSLFVGKSEWEPYASTPPRREQNLAFRNTGDLGFEDVSKAWGLDHTGMSFATATADFDGDGDPDIVVVNMDEAVSLYRNDVAAGGRVSIRLEGTKSNRFGVGARIEALAGGVWQQRWLRPLSGFKSGDEPVAHFGVGGAPGLERVRIFWPSGVLQELTDLRAGQRHVVAEGGDPAPPPVAGAPVFRANAALARAVHREQEFDDYQFQPLLPNGLSRLGPGGAWGDVDGDGDDDFFLGGACGFMGQLHLNRGDGTFRESKTWTFADDRGCEDMGAVFFDADGDGDLDLFVASGGVEAPPGHPIHADRLYLNNGAGDFRRSESAIPGEPLSSGPVGAADFDRDGDIDLFVGGRLVPGQYPTAPGSRLLRNDGGGVFADATAERAPGLARTGMVTGALWSDADGDGWLDLLLAQEWGPVSLFRNIGGKLEDATEAAGLAEASGWWNGITGGDFNGDGRIDYAVTNFGLNTKYHGSAEHPALLYYGDVDGSGTKNLIEAEFEGATCFPIRGKSCSTHAMPSLAGKFESYHSFALAELTEIYPPERLATALRFEASELRSGVLLNRPDGTFSFTPLPRLAQIAPGFGIVAGEFDGDGHTDLVLAQNFFSPQPETGRMDGGLSLLLAGAGDGTFLAVGPLASGIVVGGDAKGLTAADGDGDGRPDLHFAVNAGSVHGFAAAGGEFLAVRLPWLPGTRVTLEEAGSRTQTAELYAGSGYLSQSAPILFLASPKRDAVMRVRWPDGGNSRVAVPARTTQWKLSPP